MKNIRKFSALWGGMTALAVGIGMLGAQPTAMAQAKNLAFEDFEAGVGSWMIFGPNAKVSVTNETAKVKNGKGALEFKYVVGGKKPTPKPAGEKPNPLDAGLDILLRPTPNGELTQVRTLKFWAKADTDTPLVVTLSEKDGGRYLHFVWLPKDTWHQISLEPSDFWLTDD